MGYQKVFRICGNEKQTTFKPLARGRVRCNQTGAVMPRQQAVGYRNRRHAQMYPRSREARKEKVRIQSHKIKLNTWDSEFSCPNPSCEREHRIFTQNAQFKCSCGHELVVTRLPWR